MKASGFDRQMYDNIFSKYSAKDKLVLILTEAIKDIIAERYCLAIDTMKVALDYTEELKKEKRGGEKIDQT